MAAVPSDIVPLSSASPAAAPSDVVPLPTDIVPLVTTRPEGPAPKTTASGIAASAARGLAPTAAGAAIGAAAGAPFAGVGAVPGAIAGMGAANLGDFGGSLYNMLADRAHLPSVLTPTGATDRMFDAMGIKRPATETERLTKELVGLAPLGMGSAKGAADLGEAIATNKANAGERYIREMYQRVIKPSTTGHDTFAQRRSAISDIVSNKNELQYIDADGKVVGQGLPQSVAQFGQAIDHSKDKLFKEWDALARQAGDQGVRVPTAGIVAELRQRAADPGLLRDDPAAARYANELADRYAAAGAITPLEAQESITRWNKKLNAFYKNPSHEGPAGEVVARNLRQSLDQTVENTVAPGYQDLKTRYGSLSAIENDVDRAARRIGNQPPGGRLFGWGGNMLAGYQAAHGIFTGSAREIATGVGVKGLAEYYKWRNEPNRVIKEIFKTADKYHRDPPGPASSTGPVMPPVINTGPQPARLTGQVPGPMSAGTPLVPGGGATTVPTPPIVSTGPQPLRLTGQVPGPAVAGSPAPPGGGAVVAPPAPPVQQFRQGGAIRPDFESMLRDVNPF